ncbi:MAG: phage tail sheath family protein [Bacteroidota bacterium]|jgi:phage tail sheath protein FI
MSTNPTTPGVYIREISTIPPSVAPVSTAVPGFAGYTEKGPLNTPTRISSMLEFEQIFGGAFTEDFSVNSTTLAVTPVSGLSEYRFYYHMQLYFANGGGPCWIVAADYYQSNGLITASKMKDAIEDFRPIDEVTLLVAPEAGTSTAAQATIYSEMLNQSAELQDRFAILDAKSTGVAATDASNFRGISLTNLKYGAAYYPTLKSSLSYKTNESLITLTGSATYPAPYNTVSLIRSGIGESFSVNILSTIFAGSVASLPVSTLVITVNGTPVTLTSEVDFDVTASTSTPFVYRSGADIRTNIINAIRSNATLAGKVIVVDDYDSPVDPLRFVITSIGAGSTLSVTGTNELATANVITSLATATDPEEVTYAANPVLANQLVQAVAGYNVVVSPSAIMAGVYATTDRDRGVWKAPANISLSNIIQPTVLLNDADQGGLNVDPASGKSINVIRQFSGKGNVVWGARTLAGNDNEWRYVNVRRLFNFAEESIKKATEVVVFDPNDRNTWNRVRTLISNFLTNLWRDGGLVGATTEQAFFVRVGLGETMTEDDILNGRLVVSVGLAASRPAEFIELRFSHQLQQS